VAQNRRSAFGTKDLKDVMQAAQLMEALEELRPGDLRRARREGRGASWARAVTNAIPLMARAAPEIAARLRAFGR